MNIQNLIDQVDAYFKSEKIKQLQKGENMQEKQVATDAKKASPFENMEVEIQKKGTKIILPGEPREMTEDEGIEALKRKKAQAESVVSIHEEVNAFPLEGAYALTRVLQFKYGWVDAVPTPGFFGPNPPTMVTLEIGYNEYAQVFWGSFQIPGVEGRLSTGTRVKNGRRIFIIEGQVKKKHQAEIQEIANLVRQYSVEKSLYKGKAIKITTTENEDGDFTMDLEEPPKFMDLSKVGENILIYSDDVQEQISTNLFTPIEKTDLCRNLKIPLKRTVLLEGRYGTGKTLVSLATAKKAVDNKWTFIYLDRVSALKDILIFARQYAPAVIFAEDVERVVSGTDRSVAIDDVLNTIDGIDSKNQEVICVFTTNHVEKIQAAMLRPGRIDAIISVTPPDAKAAEKLIRSYAHGLIGENESVASAGKELEGQIPAVIREVVEKSKLYAIGRMKNGEPLTLSGEDVRHAAIGMKAHLELMNPKKEKALSPTEKLGVAMVEAVSEGLTNNQTVQALKVKTQEIHDQLM